MGTALAIRFPWGLYHATPWDRNVNEAVVEWPPSLWRLLRALYATWSWRAPDADERIVRELLSSLSEPPAYYLPAYVEAHTRHYMPRVTHMKDRPKWKTTVEHSDDDKDKVLDAFVVTERDAEVVVRWDLDLDGDTRAELARLAGCLGYLGRADSICEARLIDPASPPAESTPGGEWLEPIVGDALADPMISPARVLVPRRPLDLGALTIPPRAMRAKGLTTPPGAEWVSYRAPEPAHPRARPRRAAERRATAIRWAYSSVARPSIKAAVAVADVLRQACMSQYGRRSGGGVSAALAGKDPSGRPLEGHRHAHYLPVDLDRDGDGLIDHLVVWAPAGLGEEESAALAALDRLTGYGFVSDFRPGRLGLEAVGSIGAVAPELVGPASVWRTRTPFSPPRHPKRRQTLAAYVDQQVREELARRSLPAPREVRLLPGDWLTYRRHRIRERLEDGRRAVGVEIEFDRPVCGPVVIGALSHFGLGLFEPAGD